MTDPRRKRREGGPGPEAARGGPHAAAPARARIRCAIYTRKSSEEGLDQEFNSLDAQREACEAYIKSQRHEGWVVLPALYDDPAYSGGTMERPALKRLLSDIEACAVDTVVVYKVDRLTRSLADFAKIVEAFDARGVSFVSVTQAFNTTTSMGRLTLNVLLSFAQFEREVTGERIRDKIEASKKKGLWMGGLPALGYDVRERKLIVNEVEAETVRHIFRRYLALGSVRELKAELDAGGIVSKARVAADGGAYGAKSFSRGALYQILQNRINLGDIVHKGVAHKGEHAAIVDGELFAKVQTLLDAHRVERAALDDNREPKPLTGIVFDATGELMSPSHALKKGVRYRYYVSRALIVGRRSDTPLGQRLPAPMLEGLVITRVKQFLGDPKAVLDAMPRSHRGAVAQLQLKAAAAAALKQIEQHPHRAWNGFIRPILTRVQVLADRIEMNIDAGRLVGQLSQTNAADADGPPTFGGLDGDRHTGASSGTSHAGDDDHAIQLSIPAKLKRTGKELRFVIAGDPDPGPIDDALVRLLVRARRIQRRIEGSCNMTLEEIGAAEKVTAGYITRLLRLNFLAPAIVEAILAGSQPPSLTANKLMMDTRLPLDWREQRAQLGFARADRASANI